MEPMELRTHTSLWRIEKRLHKVYDYTLPVPISFKQIGIFAVVTVPWVLLMTLLGVPFAPPFGHLMWVAPPVAAAYYANKPVIEGKRLGELLTSQVRYLLQPRHLDGAQPARSTAPVRVYAAVWRPTRPSQNTRAGQPAE